MRNIKAIINGHNKKVLNNQSQTTNIKCNCLQKNECPLNGLCQTKNVIYEATVSSNDPFYKPQKYIGLSETTFKKRFANHKKSFKNNRYENDTELSKEIWKIKKQNFVPIITWKIRKKSPGFNRSSMKCFLCLNEKLEIISYEGDNLLNKRSELISKCIHLNKHTLSYAHYK